MPRGATAVPYSRIGVKFDPAIYRWTAGAFVDYTANIQVVFPGGLASCTFARAAESTGFCGALPKAKHFWGYIWGSAEVAAVRTSAFSFTYRACRVPSAPPFLCEYFRQLRRPHPPSGGKLVANSGDARGPAPEKRDACTTIRDDEGARSGERSIARLIAAKSVSVAPFVQAA